MPVFAFRWQMCSLTWSKCKQTSPFQRIFNKEMWLFLWRAFCLFRVAIETQGAPWTYQLYRGSKKHILNGSIQAFKIVNSFFSVLSSGIVQSCLICLRLCAFCRGSSESVLWALSEAPGCEEGKQGCDERRVQAPGLHRQGERGDPHPPPQQRAPPPVPDAPPAPLSAEAAAPLCHLCHPAGGASCTDDWILAICCTDSSNIFSFNLLFWKGGDATFNRAKLLNVGYLEALKDYNWDCFIFHDVDLVPENDRNLYVCDNQPKHLVVGRNATGYKWVLLTQQITFIYLFFLVLEWKSSVWLWVHWRFPVHRLRYKGYFGGVTALTRDQFRQVNGFSNTYWGWGGEDDDLRIRWIQQSFLVFNKTMNTI